MSNSNGFEGTKKDFASAWIFRAVVIALIGYTANQQHDQTAQQREQTVAMRAVAASSQSSNEAVIKIKADLDIRLPRIEQDIQRLNDKSVHAVTDDQLKAAEMRVRDDFKKLLDDQIKTIPVQTGPSPKRPKQ